jgi:hypothetical protein
MNTNWSSPKRNIFAALLLLRSALASGQNARLIKLRNEDCAYPIKEKHVDEDWRNYEFSSGHLSTREDIYNNTSMSEMEKYLSLEFKTCYGTEEAVNRYYETGLLSPDNFKGMGRSHLVKVRDMITFLLATDDKDRAEMFKHQYFTEEGGRERHFYDFYRYKHGSPWAIKKFRRKLWVVELLGEDEQRARIPVALKIMNVILSPVFFIMKWIPRRSVLKMDKYKVVTFRVGDVTNGLAVEFHIPRNFSFN